MNYFTVVPNSRGYFCQEECFWYISGANVVIQLKRFIQFSVFFLILIGSLSMNAGFSTVYKTVQSTEVEDLNILENQPIDCPVSLAEQDLEVNQLVWSQNFSNSEYATGKRMVECENGDYGVLGILSKNGQVETILMRIDSSGNQLWNRTFHYANDTYGNSIVLCSDGGFAIAGQIRNTTIGGYYIGWLLRTNSTGHQKWNMTFYGSGSCGGFTDLIQTNNGGFVLVGWDFSYLLYDDEIIVAETDENGTLLWVEYYYAVGSERSASIIKCASGEFAVSGSTFLYGNRQSILMRIDDSSHLVQWYRTFYSDILYPPLVECDNGDFLVGGDHALLRIDSDGELKELIEFPVRVLDVVLLDTNRIVITGDNTLVCKGENTASMLSIPLGFSTQSIERSSNGEFVVTGSLPLNIIVVRVPWLEWNQTISDVFTEYATPLSLDLNATCSQGIDSWIVNDTTHFDIDSQGVLTNIGTLDVGEYPLEIIVNDTLGNQLIQRFTVIVEDTTAPAWLQTPGTVFLEAGDAFYYDLNATDASGTLLWSLSATYTFAIIQTGVITNTMELSVGTYLIEVHVQDASGNILLGTVTLQVEDTQYPTYLVPPSDQVFPYGELIEFDIIAYDISGIATLSQNCTDFTMLLDTDGPITTAHFTSNGLLALGVYGVEITIGDTYDNNVTTSMSITVMEETSTTTETTTTTSITTTTTTSTSTSSTTTGGTLDDTQILMLGLGSGIGGAVLVLVVFQLIKRRSP